MVAALIAVMAGAILFGLRRGDEGLRLRQAESVAASAFRMTQTHAGLQSTRGRLLILETPDEAERHLRWLGMVVESPDRPGFWEAIHHGESLPRGVVFHPEYSRWSGTMQLAFPRSTPQPEGIGERWYYYECSSRGQLTAEGRQTLVFTLSGTDAEELLGGFAIFQLGEIVFPQDPQALLP